MKKYSKQEALKAIVDEIYFLMNNDDDMSDYKGKKDLDLDDIVMVDEKSSHPTLWLHNETGIFVEAK